MVHVVFICVAAIDGTAMGAAVAAAAMHDHFDQVQLASTVGNVHSESLQLL